MTWNLSWRRADRPYGIGFAHVTHKKRWNNNKKAFNPSMSIAYWINNKNYDKLFGAVRIGRTYRGLCASATCFLCRRIGNLFSRFASWVSSSEARTCTRFQVRTMLTTFWNIASCSLVAVSRFFGENIYFSGRDKSSPETSVNMTE